MQATLGAAVAQQHAAAGEIVSSVAGAAQGAAEIARRAAEVAAGSQSAVHAVDQAEACIRRFEDTVEELRQSVGSAELSGAP